MKMKKRMVSKPKFCRIWAKRFIISLCIAVILCIIGTYIAVIYYRIYVNEKGIASYNAAINRLQSSYNDIDHLENLSDESKLDYWKTKAHWTFDTLLGANTYSYNIYNVETHELLVKEEDFAYIIFGKKKDEEKSRFYRCPSSIMQEVFFDYDALEEEADLKDGKRDGGSKGGPKIDILDFFLKDGSFVPGKVEVSILKDEYYEEDEDAYTLYKTYDFTPKNPGEYEHIEVDRDIYRVMGPIWLGRERKNQAANNLLKDFIENDDIWDDDTSDSKYIFGGVEYIDTDTVMIGGKLPVKFVVATHYSLFEDNKKWIVIAYTSVFVFVLLLSLGISYYSFMIRMNHFEMDAYRRETTNAMAHDLKTPLTAISGYAENLKNKVHTEKMDYYTDAILDNVWYMNEIVGNILELAKLENSNQTLKRETIHLKELTEEILKKYEILMEDKKVLVHMDGESIIKAEPFMMMQMMENLVGNAIKYSRADTEITITLTDTCCKIHNVMESKPQVPAEELLKPFVKGENCRNGQKGSGIGLTIVKNIIDLHGYILKIRYEGEMFMSEVYFKNKKK